MTKKAKLSARAPDNDSLKSVSLAEDIRSLIRESRASVASAVNAELTLLYWRIGRRIQSEVLKGERAEYGRQVVQTLSAQLVVEFGSGWGEKQLRHCLRAAETFQEEQIVYTLCRQFSWSHLRILIYRRSPQKGVLHRDLPPGTLERTPVAGADELYAVRAYRPVAQTGGDHPP